MNDIKWKYVYNGVQFLMFICIMDGLAFTSLFTILLTVIMGLAYTGFFCAGFPAVFFANRTQGQDEVHLINDIYDSYEIGDFWIRYVLNLILLVTAFTYGWIFTGVVWSYVLIGEECFRQAIIRTHKNLSLP